MFSIYGETGRVFHGAMEDLWRIEAVRRTARTRAVLPHAELRTRPGPPAPATTAALPSTREALTAYARSEAPDAQRHPLTLVQDVMSAQVHVLAADASVRQAWQQLAGWGVGQAPVVDAEGRLVGLLCRADLLQPERLPGADSGPQAWRALLAELVASLMWTPVPAVDAQTELRRVARVLLDTRLPGLPVVDDAGQVCGFISRTDILRAVVHDPPLDLWS